MVTDPIADLLTRIRNAVRRGHETALVPASKLKSEILRVLKSEGFVGGFDRVEGKGISVLKIQLRYVSEGRPIITGMRRISKPGRRVYIGRRNVNQVMGGMGLAILSTSRGVMTDHECRRAGLGGEVLCHIW
jgi:small subunit ribosomal protein S8